MADERKLTIPDDVQFHPDLHLMVFRNRGILDEERVNEVVAFIEQEEDLAERPFNRYSDLSKLDAVDLDFRFVFQISLYRRLVYGNRTPVKSAFYVTSPATTRVVRIHALMTDHSPLRVAMFHDIGDAAQWLEVPREVLE